MRHSIRYAMAHSVAEINEKSKAGDAVVLTAQEVRESLAKGDSSVVRQRGCCYNWHEGADEWHYAILSFPVAAHGTFERAVRATINGVPVVVGPLSQRKTGDPRCNRPWPFIECTEGNYGAGHLFRDMVERKNLKVELVTNDGAELSSEVTIDEMKTAKLMATRHAFRNYVALTNPGKKTFRTIFHPSRIQTRHGRS